MNTPTITATTGTTDTGIPASLKREAPKKYDFHPLADLFPMLEDKSAAFEALVEDIRERKQQEPVWLYEGKILDGRNRYLACQKLEHVPSQLNQGDSLRAKDERVYRH